MLIMMQPLVQRLYLDLNGEGLVLGGVAVGVLPVRKAGVDMSTGRDVDGNNDSKALGVVALGDLEDLTLSGCVVGDVGLGGGRAGDRVLAVVGIGALLVGVDKVLPDTLGVLRVAVALEILDGPLLAGGGLLLVKGHGLGHGLGHLEAEGSRSSDGCGGENGSEGSLGEHLGRFYDVDRS